MKKLSVVFTNGSDCNEIELEANPYYYNYFHTIILNKNGDAIFVDGGSQSVYGKIKGKFELNKENRERFTLNFFDLVLVDPKDENRIFSEIDSFEVGGYIRDITLHFKIYDEQKSYNKLIEFDFDPFIMFRDYCTFYPASYFEEGAEEMKELFPSSPNYAKNGLYFNELTRTFFTKSEPIQMLEE